MLLKETKTKRSGRQSTAITMPASPHYETTSPPLALYLPSDLGIIVPSQWLDLHRRWRPCDSPEGQLMLAVLAQALADYRQGTILERRSAKNWFSRRGEAFDFTCELIGVDADRVRKAIFSKAPESEPDEEPVTKGEQHEIPFGGTRGTRQRTTSASSLARAKPAGL
jgi:hypothetical protein